MDKEFFNPNAAATLDCGIFGLPCSAEEAEIIIIPVEWELTTSYNKGTSKGPKAVLDGSMQVDLCHHDYPDLWQRGIWMDEFSKDLREEHDRLIPASNDIIHAIESGDPLSYPGLTYKYEAIEDATEASYYWLRERIGYWKSQGKIVGLLGGEHSIPLPYHQYLNSVHTEYGILHIDAHSDLRQRFEGFRYSHASICYNALRLNTVKKLIQVGIRDYCHEEKQFIADNNDRITVFYDRDCRKRMYEGETWKSICDEIIGSLPEKVYVSVDIDGLDPKLCPNTGTPVPGGLEYEELMYLLNRLKKSDKTIVGFDLCEVSPGKDNEWDGNVGARVLYHLCGLSV